MAISVERVATGLHFPTSLAFDDAGQWWVAESGLPFAGAPAGGRVRNDDGVLIEGLRAPVNGLLWHDGAWIVSEGGRPGRLSRVARDGARTTLVDDLPTFGDYQTNMAVIGNDGKLYFSQGAATNLGVVGPDSFDLGWLQQIPDGADIPGLDIVVAGDTFETPDPRTPGARALTSAYAMYGVGGEVRRIAGRVPCTAAVLRCNVDGSALELFAWGLRNAFGLLVMPDGRLIATEQGANDRGSRRVGNAPDLLYEVTAGRWYGFPDYVGRLRVDDPQLAPSKGAPARPVIVNAEELPPRATPLFEFPVNAAPTKLTRVPDGAHAGDLLVCLFGDERPISGPPGPKVGRHLVRVSLETRRLERVELDVALHRPIDVRVHDGFVYVVDFGHLEMAPGKVDATAGSGAVYRFPLAAL